MKLTNEEIARVFAMYLGQNIVIKDITAPYTKSGRLMSVTLKDAGSYFVYNNILSGLGDYYCSNGMLELTPLPSITDEHAIEVAKMAGFRSFLDVNGKATIKDCFSDGSTDINFHPLRVLNINQYLIQQGYAVPILFGPNHWANGKTAIELGIAISK